MMILKLIVIVGIFGSALIGSAAGNLYPVYPKCSNDADCNGSTCIAGTGKCMNPFFDKGCLRTMIERRNETQLLETKRWYNVRVCNSTEVQDGTLKSGACAKSKIDYFNTVMIGANWDTAQAIGWIIEILLTEVLEVPLSYLPGHGVSLYDKNGRYEYDGNNIYPWEALETAHRVGGLCDNTDKPCAHFMPDVWEGGQLSATKYHGDKSNLGAILPDTTSSNGVIGNFGYYIPTRTAKLFPKFVSFYGLQGEANRKEIASLFKTPTNWTDYCALEISNCEEGDEVAQRPPNDEEEKASYFKEGLYTGYFRDDFSNNCDINPNCTGHVILPPCGWSVYSEAQFYWNDIALAGKGPLAPSGGYTFKHTWEIYDAANATKSDVVMWNYFPDSIPERYFNTDYQLQRILFPEPTGQCEEFRVNGDIDKCSELPEKRRGSDSRGSCDYGVKPIKKVFSRGFLDASISEDVPEPIRNPAFDLVKLLTVSPYAMPTIFQDWTEKRKSSNVIDSRREAVCEYVYENLDTFTESIVIPNGYPRSIKLKATNQTILSTAGLAIGSLAFVASIVTFTFVFKWRNLRVFRMAQVDTLFAALTGYTLIALGGIMGSSNLNTVTCTMNQWLLHIGYTLSFMPNLIKISTINKINDASVNFRRVTVDRYRFKKRLVLVMSLLMTYLIVWTAVDGPRDEKEYDYGDDEFTVVSWDGCSLGESQVWRALCFAWECILLVTATILTIQSYHVMEELNETRYFAFMIYSHFFFLLMRLLTFLLANYDRISTATQLRITSILVSCDAMAAIAIYFIPKFLQARAQDVPKSDFGNVSIYTQEGISACQTSKGRRLISGINIPAGGIPNLIRPSESEDPRLSFLESSGKVSSIGHRSSMSDLTINNRISFSQRQLSQSFTVRCTHEKLDSNENLSHVNSPSTSSNFPIDSIATDTNKSLLAVAKEIPEFQGSNEEPPEKRNMNISDDKVEFSVAKEFPEFQGSNEEPPEKRNMNISDDIVEFPVVLMKKETFPNCTMALKTNHLVPSVPSNDEHDDEKV